MLPLSQYATILNQCFPMIISLIILSMLSRNVGAFPQGAPMEACESLSPEYGHGVAGQPVEYAPFGIIQAFSQFNPGDKVPVEIVQRHPQAHFRGFLVQALDAEKHEVMGEFLVGKGMQSLRECAAVTHTDNRPKKSANLVWVAPSDRSGKVLFRGTIVIRKDLYYPNILAQDASEDRK